MQKVQLNLSKSAFSGREDAYCASDSAVNARFSLKCGYLLHKMQVISPEATASLNFAVLFACNAF